MTEAEWLACADDIQLLTHARGRASARKLRLLAVDVVLCVAHRIQAPEYLEAIQLAEDWAEGVGNVSVLERRHDELLTAFYQDRRFASDSLPGRACLAAIKCLEPNPYHAASSSPCFACAAASHFEPLTSRFVAAMHRDIFGNPFRSVAFSPAWRTDTAVAVARHMYESREFGAMPILADALQDAGCEDEHILSHCRDANATHVRGCWVVDLVLGKE